MTEPEPVLTCRYVSDGEVGHRVAQERRRRVARPALILSLVVVGLVLGMAASLLSYSDSVPPHLGRVLLIGVFWGVCWLAALVLLIAILVIPLARRSERRLSARYPAGSVTAVLLSAEEMEIVRPSGERSEIDYRVIRRVRSFASLLAIYRRGTFWPLTLPSGALTDEALAYIDERVHGSRPVSVDPAKADVTRSFVVPHGWAAHAAGVYTRANLRRPAFLLRFGLTSLLVVAVGALLSWWWVLAVPILFVAVVLSGYVSTRRMLDRAVPDGSLATTEVLENRLISRNAGGVREIRYDDVRGLKVHGDVVVMRLASLRGFGLLARPLVPDELLQRQ